MSERSAGAGGMSGRHGRNVPSATRAAAVALAGLLGFVGCGDGGAGPNPPPPLPGSGGGSPAGAGSGSGAGSSECAEGATRSCKITVSEHDGVLTCYAGTQRCIGGSFGPCEDGTFYEQPAPERAEPSPGEAGDEEEGGYVFRSLSTAGDCAHNPCDPACAHFDEQPAASISPAPQQVGSYQTQPDLSYLPGGFENKGLKDPNHPPTTEPCDDPGDCQFDHKCNHTTGLCERWGTSEVDAGCDGANLTTAPPCNNTTVPVCNRGTKTAVAPADGIEVLVLNGNSNQLQDNLGLCQNYQGTVAGRCKVTESIPPGQCRNAVCPSGLLQGTQGLVVNPPKPPALVTPIAECSCADNWSVYSSGGTCTTLPVMDTLPVTFKETYVASCPPGTVVQWGHLAYSASTPSTSAGTSTVKIEGQVAQSPATFPATCASPECVTLAFAPSPDPSNCPLSGPSPCPKDLFSLFGLPKARYDQLELTFTLTPSPFGTPPIYFQDDFSSNAQGWTLGTEWQIGAAKASTGHSHQFPDPASDNTPTADNGVAGAVIGGNVSTAVHDYYYLTSPVIPLAVSGSVTLEYYRWLNSDFKPYMTNVVEVFDGTKWVRVFESADVAIGDTFWRRLTHDVTAYKNANFRVRFGYNVAKSNPWVVSGWNLDDVRIYGDAPGKVSPSLHDWSVTYSCPDSE